MRVLQIVHDFLPGSHAGVEVYTHSLGLGLKGCGVEVAVAHPIQGVGLPQYSLRHLVVDGMPVVQMVQNYPYRPLTESTSDPQAERRFLEIMERFRPDRVHLQHLWGWSAGLPRLARQAGVPVVMHLHDHWLACPSGGQRYRQRIICDEIDPTLCDTCYGRFQAKAGPLERIALRAARKMPRQAPPDTLHRGFLALPRSARMWLKRVNRRASLMLPPRNVEPGISKQRRTVLLAEMESVDLFLAPSLDMAERMVAWGIDDHRIRHVPNGSSISAEDPVQLPRLADPSAPLRLVFLGTPMEHKGLHVLADAISRVPEDVELVIHGAEPTPSYLSKLHLDGKRVRFGGLLKRGDVSAAIDAADLICLPSIWPENAPLVLLEARARRRPVLASRLGGVPETAQGILVPPADVNAWTTAISRLARDRESLRRLATRITPPPTMQDNVAQVLDAYHSVE